MTDIISINERRATPEPNLTIEQLIGRSWRIEDAISELIDNSFGEARGNAHTIRFRWFPAEGENGLLEIFDNGQGMADLKDLFTLGKGAGKSRRDIGKYGSGGSQAIVWLASKVEVISIRKSDGLTSSYKAIWADWQKMKEWPEIPYNWETVDMHNVPWDDMRKAKHGTVVRLWLRAKHHKPRPESLIEKIAERYAPALRAGKRITWQTINKRAKKGETPVIEQVNAPAWIDGDTSVYDEATVETPKGEFKIEIEAYLLEPDSKVKPGINIEFDKIRVIIGRADSKACFIDRKNARPINVSNVAGRVVLGHEWVDFLTTNKEDFNDENVKQAFYDAVFETLRPLLIEAEQAQRSAMMLEFSAKINEALSIDIAPDAPGGGDKGDKTPNEEGEGASVESVESAGKWPTRDRKPRDPDKPTREPNPETERKYPWMKPTDTKREGSKTKRRVHVGGSPRHIMEWTPVPDDLMAGQWCYVEAVSGCLLGYVNESCETIMAAFNDPSMRRELSFMVIPEISEAIASDEELTRRIFPNKVEEWLNTVAYNTSATMRRLIQAELAKRLKLD